MTEQHKPTGWTDTKVLILFITIALAFGFLSARSEFQQADIEAANAQIAASQFHECEVRNESAQSLNTVLDAIIGQIKTAPNLTPAKRVELTALYASAKARLVDCGARP